ncbi:MAG TPA: L-rhamnose/proton symporter RhaT [Verrucomicrobiae bacterium]|jgi:L-rhamnose-H+ transport protein|nr:L-rhamnose/proton symporter RhaT [Verrucomicrobiae bacterium]
MNPLIPGFGFIFLASVAGGAFGLQYRVQRKYAVANTALLSMFFATIVVPLIVINFVLPGWTRAISATSMTTLATVFFFGFGWGLGAITYAFGFNMLGMALGAAMIKGVSVALGSGIPLIRRWHTVPSDARLWTIAGILLLLVGTAVSGRAGILRERDTDATPLEKTEEFPAQAPVTGGAISVAEEVKVRPAMTVHHRPKGKVFWQGMMWCAISGLLSGCANLGYDFGEPLEQAASHLGRLDLYATLIRWMPMYWGGITALFIFMGGSMWRTQSWKNYFAPGSLRDFIVASSMGGVHFLAQIPYGIGAYYLGKLGTTVGFGVNLGMALIVASGIGFMTGEWKGASKRATHNLYGGIAILIAAMAILAYGNSLAQGPAAGH